MIKKIIFVISTLLICVLLSMVTISITEKKAKDNKSNSSPGHSSMEENIYLATPQTTHEQYGDVDQFVEDNILTTEATTEETTEFPESFDIELEIIYQYPELPAGCEAVALTIILNHLGYDLGKTDIADDYLVYANDFVSGYSGNPYSYETGGGCYAPGLTTTAENFFKANGNKHTVQNITGTDFDVLLEYVAQGTPVLVWTTINLAECSKGMYNYDVDGTAYQWDFNEHCVVLSGYDLKAGTVTVYDPIDGVLYRDLKNFKRIYNDMQQMALIIQ